MSSKIDAFVKFPVDGLDMSPYMYRNIAGFVAGCLSFDFSASNAHALTFFQFFRILSFSDRSLQANVKKKFMTSLPSSFTLARWTLVITCAL
jgi:hypothetical protein